MSKALVLTVMTGPHIGKHFTIHDRQGTIGSASINDVVVPDRAVDSRHAEVHQMLDRWFITPTAPNGRAMLLNGMPISGRSRLNPGDRLTVGSVTYSVSYMELMEQEFGAPRPSGGVPRLGDYFVRRGLMNSEQVSRTVQRQAELAQSGNRVVFGQLAYEMGFISRSQLETALAEQRNDFDERFRD
jgi:predicted component of type VI protein secretion system